MPLFSEPISLKLRGETFSIPEITLPEIDYVQEKTGVNLLEPGDDTGFKTLEALLFHVFNLGRPETDKLPLAQTRAMVPMSVYATEQAFFKKLYAALIRVEPAEENTPGNEVGAESPND